MATKLGTYRVDEALLREAQRIARRQREPLAVVIRRALVAYVETHGGSIEPADED